MAAPNPLFSTLFGDATKWTEPTPDHAVVLGAVGSGSAADQTTAKRHVLNMAVHSPTVVAFVIDADCDHIYVGHSPTQYPASLGTAMPFDNLLVVLVGDSADAAVPMVLPNAAFARTNDFAAYNVAHLTGVHGHGAGPPAVTRFATTASGTANTDDFRVRRFFVFPHTQVLDALTTEPSGCYSLVAFYNEFLQAGLASPNAAEFEPLAEWWRGACMNTAGGATRCASTAVLPGTPVQAQALALQATRTKEAALARIGLGGPGLSSAAFQHGVTNITATITDRARERLQYERDRQSQSFSQKHGDQLAQVMYHLRGVPDDASLPNVHQLLARAPKGRDYGILNNLLAARAQDSRVPLTYASAPMATTKITEEVYRTFRVAGTGLNFGEGLSPFAVVCEGHSEIAAVRKMIKQAELAEGGTSMSLADAEKLTASDVRFPTTPQVAAEKLYGWSVHLDVFHGPLAQVAINAREFVINVGPALHRVCEQMGSTETLGMDLVNRVLYEVQQEYFEYVTKLSQGTAGLVAPDFAAIQTKVLTYRVNSLCPLPASWYTMVDRESPGRTRAAARESGTSPRSQAGAVATFNTFADRTLMRRFRDSDFSSVSAMIADKDVQIPKHKGKPVCLVWALKGECGSGCKRIEQHKKYSDETNTAISKVLDKCGVANPHA